MYPFVLKGIIIIIIITMFIQGNLFNTLSVVINEGPVKLMLHKTLLSLQMNVFFKLIRTDKAREIQQNSADNIIHFC